jgi:hypothetical protein
LCKLVQEELKLPASKVKKTSEDKKTKSQSKQTTSKKFPIIDWVVIMFFVLTLTPFIIWSSQREPQNFGLQPLETSTIFALPIESNSEKSHQENLSITGNANGRLQLSRSMEGSFDLTFTHGIRIKEVIITTMYHDRDNSVDILYRAPIEYKSVISAKVDTVNIDMDTYPEFELHTSAQYYEFMYDEKGRTMSDGFTVSSVTEGDSTLVVHGRGNDSITTNKGLMNSVYVIQLFGVKQIKFGDDTLVTPENISFVVVPDGDTNDEFPDYYDFEINSNITDLWHYPDMNNPKIDIHVSAPVIKLLEPSGTLTVGTEKQELSIAFDAVKIKAANDFVTANIKSEMGIYETLIEGKSSSIVVNDVEKINQRWQRLGSDWRILPVVTFFSSIFVFILQRIYQFFKDEKAL